MQKAKIKLKSDYDIGGKATNAGKGQSSAVVGIKQRSVRTSTSIFTFIK